MKVRNMTTGKPAGLILSVALPLMIGNVFQQMYTVVDTAIVGNVLGVTALAALGSSDWFNWLFMSIAQGFAQGFSIPIAQDFGAQDGPALRRDIVAACVLSALLAIILCVIALSSISPVLALLNTPESIRPIARLYIVIIFSGTPIVMAYNLLAGILRSLGDGKTPLYAMIVASLVNIALDLLFVALFRWGVAGAAVATLIGQACSCVFCLWRMRTLEVLRFTRSDFALERPRMLRLLRLGSPLALQNMVIAVGGMIVQRVVNGMGVLFIAGYTATNKLYGLLEVAATSFGYATTTYVGQNVGARRFDRIRSGLRAALAMGVLAAAFVGCVTLLFGRSILSTFITGTPEEIAQSLSIAYEFLCVMSVCLPILYILYVYRSALQGLGDTLMPMISGFAEFAMRIAAVLFLPGFIGYRGVFWAETLAWTGATVILVVSYYVRFRTLRKACSDAADANAIR